MRSSRALYRLLAALTLCASFAFGQGTRYGTSPQVTSSTVVSGVTNAVVIVQPNASVNYCQHPANAVPCTNLATTYTDATLATPCSLSTQIVLDNSNTCVALADSKGQWGVWVPAGCYDYTITVSGFSSGPYYVCLGAAPSNGGDSTKQFVINTSSSTTGTTSTLKTTTTSNRTYTIPDATDTFAMLGVTQTFTNKSFDDSLNQWINHSDATKQTKVSLGSASTGTSATETYQQTSNRTYTHPDASITYSGGVFQDCGSTSGATQNCANTTKFTFWVVRGDVTLNSATTQAIGSLPFTSSSSYSCTCSDLTTAAGICNFTTYTSGASATIQESSGTNADHLRYTCTGF